MGISSVTGTNVKIQCTWNAANTLTGADYVNGLSNANTIGKTVNYGTGFANAAVGGADEVISFIQTLAASASVTLDLTSLTNILQQTGVTLARVKAWVFRLLSVADDSVNGSACSNITIGNAAANPFLFNTWGGTTPTQDVKAGDAMCYAATSAGGFTVAGGNKNVKIVNQDGVNSAAIQVTIIGGTT